MATRKKIPEGTQFEVVYLSARRCCMCLAIESDFGEKSGQIAHLDQNRTNDDLDNLAWLCLPHHDAYDSKTSQSKGYSKSEVRKYRSLLHTEVERWRQNRFHKENDAQYQFKRDLIEANLAIFLFAAMAAKTPAIRATLLERVADIEFKEQLMSAWAFLDSSTEEDEPGLSRENLMAQYIGFTDEGKEDLKILLGLSGSAISAMNESDRNHALFALKSDTIRSGLLLLHKIRTERNATPSGGG